MYCWCGTRLTTDTDVLRMHCSAHGYQDTAYGPTAPVRYLPVRSSPDAVFADWWLIDAPCLGDDGDKCLRGNCQWVHIQ